MREARRALRPTGFGRDLRSGMAARSPTSSDIESLARESRRLEELRLSTLEGRIEAELDLGLHAQLVGELETLVAEHPLRERLWRQLVLALYRCERQADALATYRRARDLLAGELGLEPSEELRRLEQAVLRQDVPPVARRPDGHNLPAQLTSFVGREHELAELERLLPEARLLTLTGVGGVGKTRLALELAARVVEELSRTASAFVDLSGLADPALAPQQIAQVLGLRESPDLPLVELLRNHLTQEPMSCSSWTTASIFFRPAPSSWRRCCRVPRRFASWRPVGRHSVSRARWSTRSCRSLYRQRTRIRRKPRP